MDWRDFIALQRLLSACFAGRESRDARALLAGSWIIDFFIVYCRLFFVEEVTTGKKERQQQCSVKFNRDLSFSRNIDPPIWYDTDVKLFEIQRV